jgi:hypothetical protein
MGKRARQRGKAEKLTAPDTEYVSENVPPAHRLVLRGALTAGTRRKYDDTLRGGLQQEDAWQRAVELLFERLAVRWTINDVPTEGQRELLMRFRVSTPDERRWVRDVLREHCAEHFPELQAP